MIERIRGMLARFARGDTSWATPEFKPGLESETAVGRRYFLHLQFDPSAEPTTDVHPFNLSPANRSTVMVRGRSLGTAELYDRQAHNKIDLIPLLPSGYQLRLVELEERDRLQISEQGVDTRARTGKDFFARVLPVSISLIDQTIAIPTYHLEQEADQIDRTVIDLAYCLGFAVVTDDIITKNLNPSNEEITQAARKYAQRLLRLASLPPDIR